MVGGNLCVLWLLLGSEAWVARRLACRGGWDFKMRARTAAPRGGELQFRPGSVPNVAAGVEVSRKLEEWPQF